MAFRLFGFSGIPTSVEFFVYTTSGRLSYSLDINGDFVGKEYILLEIVIFQMWVQLNYNLVESIS